MITERSVIHVLGVVCGALIGWSASQLTFSHQIIINTQKIEDDEKTMQYEVANRQNADVVISDRVTAISIHIDKIIEQNNQLIAFIKAQGIQNHQYVPVN